MNISKEDREKAIIVKKKTREYPQEVEERITIDVDNENRGATQLTTTRSQEIVKKKN